MRTTATRIAATAFAATLALCVAVPASAADWGSPRQLMAQIAQLDREVNRAEARRTISPREAAALDRQVDRLRADYRSFARGGFTRAEVASLNRGIDTVQRRLVAQGRDGNRYPGRDRDSRDQWDHRR